ncbi:hypothetical protein EUGRSUZ_C03965 [Eucalyptus grandis]|uniref:Uncharacterized protein n=2 Tax=Eucalyptus grandis TaxID=71139 RepID=A0ACC3LK22_EUCGR|nr:hypothetical protein EUGRSUZ_C03965 [Eucalyptus grandis]
MRLALFCTNNREAPGSEAFATSNFFLQELSQLFALSLSLSLSRKCSSCSAHLLLHLSTYAAQKSNRTEVTFALIHAMIIEPTLPLPLPLSHRLGLSVVGLCFSANSLTASTTSSCIQQQWLQSSRWGISQAARFEIPGS